MRNSGWYIPFWRRPKKKGRTEKPGTDNISRSDEQLESVRQRWIERYRRTARSLRLMGLSMGSNRAEVQARYDSLRDAGTVPLRDLDDAYRFLMRVLPPLERRRRRPPSREESGAVAASVETGDIDTVGDAREDAGDESLGTETDEDDEDDLDDGAEGDATDAAEGGDYGAVYEVTTTVEVSEVVMVAEYDERDQPTLSGEDAPDEAQAE